MLEAMGNSQGKPVEFDGEGESFTFPLLPLGLNHRRTAC